MFCAVSVYIVFIIKKVHDVSCTYNRVYRETENIVLRLFVSINISDSHFHSLSAEFSKHWVLSGAIQHRALPRYQDEEMKLINI